MLCALQARRRLPCRAASGHRLLHTVAASTTYGCSLCHIRSQPPLHTVTGAPSASMPPCFWSSYGYSLHHILLQSPPHTVTASTTYGYSLHYIRLQARRRLPRRAAPGHRHLLRPLLRGGWAVRGATIGPARTAALRRQIYMHTHMHTHTHMHRAPLLYVYRFSTQARRCIYIYLAR